MISAWFPGRSGSGVPGRASLAVGCGLLFIYLEYKVCPEGLEPVVYWSLPIFHLFFHPWASGPNPQACLCSLVLNSVLVTGVVYLLGAKGSKPKQERRREDLQA